MMATTTAPFVVPVACDYCKRPVRFGITGELLRTPGTDEDDPGELQALCYACRSLQDQEQRFYAQLSPAPAPLQYPDPFSDE